MSDKGWFQNILYLFRYQIILFLIGVFLILLSLVFNKVNEISQNKIEIIENYQLTNLSDKNLANGDHDNESDIYAKSRLININSASKEELESLVGIGPKYAQKIIEQRPYSNINELTDRKIIPVSTFNKIKDKIII